ncbi:hypothetical protein [Noviherbaspirillum suwonense]|uniref:hypothetical protein n=1 Tax=Noviherbaspirillum suwonense TaxID=1224511 RepID=UPI0024B6DCD3|nr:hypothetical protein [Noviherbaspirillum suwonense]
MPSKNSKPGSEIAEKQKTMAELYPNLSFLPDTPDRPRYRPLASAIDHLRYHRDLLPDLPDQIDIALENLGQEMIELNEKMDTDPTFQEKTKKRID